MRLILCISSILLIANPGFSREVPKTLAYSAQPTPYFDDHADEAVADAVELDGGELAAGLPKRLVEVVEVLEAHVVVSCSLVGSA